MKVTKYYTITPEYRGCAEIDGAEILLYIEKRKRTFFDLMEYFDRVSWCKLFLLTDITGGDHTFTGVYGGHIQTLVRQSRNMDTFNLRAEIDLLYNDYLKSDEINKQRDERLNAIIDKL